MKPWKHCLSFLIGPLFIQDQGFQYQHHSWVKELKEHHVYQSMSRKATCLDNAAMESFFHLLKSETVHLYDYQSFEEVAQAEADWISYYNNDRIKEKLGGKSPVKGMPHDFITPGIILSGTIGRKNGEWFWTWNHPESVFPQRSKKYLENVKLGL
jgi:hypothetical protein